MTGPFLSTGEKVVTVAQAERWRATLAGPLVFTNGVFDLLHPGHVEYLEAARALGVALLVGVNTDQSARALGKGSDRPVNPEADRARVLAGLAAVDRVVPFAESTPLKLIETLRPDVLVKGADYRRDQVVGADLVESYGGRVVLIPLVPKQSTTNIVERIRGTR